MYLLSLSYFKYFLASGFSHFLSEVMCVLSILAAAFQVLQLFESQEYSMFTRIVFDTAPTVSDNSLVFKAPSLDYSLSFIYLQIGLQGHTLRLLSFPDFMDASIGKMMKVQIVLRYYNLRLIFSSNCLWKIGIILCE